VIDILLWFWFVFPKYYWGWTSFFMFIIHRICVSSLEKCLFKSVVDFLILLFLMLFLSWRNSSSSLDITQITYIYSFPILWAAFHFIDGVPSHQRYHYLILYSSICLFILCYLLSYCHNWEGIIKPNVINLFFSVCFWEFCYFTFYDRSLINFELFFTWHKWRVQPHPFASEHTIFSTPFLRRLSFLHDFGRLNAF
jgi:hypothetical protein